MFNLRDEIAAYCQSVYPAGVHRQARIDELADHLHCEVERWMGEGLSEQEAFHRAVDQLGSSEDLALESLRAQSAWQRNLDVLIALLTLNAKALNRLLTPAQTSVWIIGVSLFFAGMMTLTSWLKIGFEEPQHWTYLWLAVWWVPYTLLCMVAANGTKACKQREEA